MQRNINEASKDTLISTQLEKIKVKRQLLKFQGKEQCIQSMQPEKLSLKSKELINIIKKQDPIHSAQNEGDIYYSWNKLNNLNLSNMQENRVALEKLKIPTTFAEQLTASPTMKPIEFSPREKNNMSFWHKPMLIVVGGMPALVVSKILHRKKY